MKTTKNKSLAFSLIELVIVVLILGIVATVALISMKNSSMHARRKAAKTSLQILRNAIDRYYCEHRWTYPGARTDGMGNPALSNQAFINQLTLYSDINGRCSKDKDPLFPFGPYIQGKIPRLPLGKNAGRNSVRVKDQDTSLAAEVNSGDGWVYNPRTGEIIPNSE